MSSLQQHLSTTAVEDSIPRPSGPPTSDMSHMAAANEQLQQLVERFWAMEARQHSQEKLLFSIFGSAQHCDLRTPESTIFSRMQATEDKLKLIDSRLDSFSSSPGDNCSAGDHADSPVTPDSKSATELGDVSTDHTKPTDEAWIQSLEERVQLLAHQCSCLRSDMQALKQQQESLQTVCTGQAEVSTHSAQDFIVNVEPTYELQESVWDLSLLIGLPEIGTGGSLLAVLAWIGNFVLECFFVAVCFMNFLDPNITQDTVDAAIYFRELIGHDDQYFTSENLQQRICGESHTLTMIVGATQANFLSDVDSYLNIGGSAWEAAFAGPTMCVLALFCWSLTVSTEVDEMLNYVRALRAIPRHRHTQLVIASGQISIQCLSVGRLCCILSVVMLRMAIALMLYFIGCMWLANTATVSNLLLNCIALGFIMDLDEMIFVAGAPERAKAALHAIEPLKYNPWPSWQGFECKALMCVVLPLCSAGLFYHVLTKEMMTFMEEVDYQMCEKGPLDFTYTTDPMMLMYLAQSDPNQMALRQKYEDQYRSFVREVLDGGVFGKLKLSYDPMLFYQSVRYMSALTWNQMVDTYNSDCADALDEQPAQEKERWLNTMRPFLSNQDITRCADLESQLCPIGGLGGQLARVFCAETCQCLIPDSDNPSFELSYGCPAACRSSPPFLKALEELPCTQRTAEELAQTAMWPKWAAFAAEGMGADVGIQNSMLRYGCDFVYHLNQSERGMYDMIHSFCRGTMDSGLKPGAIVCPRLCLCSEHTETLEYGKCVIGPSECWMPG